MKRSLKYFTNISQIVSFIGTQNHVILDKNQKIYGFKPISSAIKGEMTFCSFSGNKGLELISSSKASLIICSLNIKHKLKKINSSLIFVDNPRLWFIRCLRKFVKEKELSGIHRTAIVESKITGKSVYLGPHVHIGKNVLVGDNTKIYDGVHIHDNCYIGKNVVIDSSTIIGSDGFGYEKNPRGEWEKFPHLGGVEIHDNVEIGANSCIDRGTLENTIIGKGTKIDNLVHIAHNVKIGKNCVIVAQSLIGGGSVLEDGSYIAMSASVRDGIRIGKNSIVGMGAVVTKNISSNVTVLGVPAKPVKNNKNH